MDIVAPRDDNARSGCLSSHYERTVMLEGAVSTRILKYRPSNVDSDTWQRVGPSVLALVAAVLPASEDAAARYLNVSAKLAVWCDQQGGEPDPAQWLERTSIDRFCVEGCRDLSPRTAINYRSILHQLRESVEWDGRSEPRPVRIVGARSNPKAPYTHTEMAAIRSWLCGLPTPQQRHDAASLVSLGAGCGLAADEILQVYPRNVRLLDSGMVVVDVPGSRSRLVVCRRSWEGSLADTQGAVSESRYIFRPGRESASKNGISHWLDKLPHHPSVGRVSTARLRTTWLVELLNERLPLAVIVQAAGLTTLQSLSPYLRYLDATSADAAARMMRGASA